MGIGLTKPKLPVAGSDAAGVVEAVGANVRGLQPGDEVFGFVRGAFAEYACAAQDKVVPKPASLTFEQAAALPIAATTALRGIRDVGEVKAGQRVLVNGAAAGWARSRSRSRWRSAPRSRASAARATSSWCARSAPRTSSTTRTRTSPPGTIRYDVILDNVSSLPLTRLRGVLTHEGDARAQRRRHAGPRVRADRHPPEGGRGQPVRLATAAPAPVEGRSGRSCST